MNIHEAATAMKAGSTIARAGSGIGYKLTEVKFVPDENFGHLGLCNIAECAEGEEGKVEGKTVNLGGPDPRFSLLSAPRFDTDDLLAEDWYVVE